MMHLLHAAGCTTGIFACMLPFEHFLCERNGKLYAAVHVVQVMFVVFWASLGTPELHLLLVCNGCRTFSACPLTSYAISVL